MRGRARLEEAGYEVQTLRIATQPWIATLPRKQRTQTLDLLVRLDEFIAAHGVILSVGPVQRDDAHDDELADWSAELIRRTQRISFSCVIASAMRAVHSASAITAAQIMRSLSH